MAKKREDAKTGEEFKLGYTQATIEVFRLSSLMDADFLGNLEKELPGTQIAWVSLMVPKGKSDEKKFERVALIHRNQTEYEEGVTTVDCDTPETLNHMIEIAKRIKEGKNVPIRSD